jgi:ATP-dependent Clp protease adaptor protein ClpS
MSEEVKRFEPQETNQAAPARPESSTAVADRPSQPKADKLPPYNVLLHNDPVNDMVYVVKTIVELTPLKKERALEVMFEAHTRGLSLVLVTHKERAELYQEQFRSKKLKVTIEPAEA